MPKPEPTEKSIAEQRQELLTVGRELREELQAFTKPIYNIIARMHAEADALLPAMADERDAKGGPKVRKVTYSKPVDSTIPTGSPILAPKLGPNKRACSICRQPGHRATTCPNGRPKK